MSDIDTAALAEPISDSEPSGPDLSYDADFLALETAAQGQPERQVGETIKPAEEPDWRDVSSRAEALLQRTKDVRVAVTLARALLRMHRFEGLTQGLTLTRELLERYWDSVHPQLEGDDATMRLNALGALGDPETFITDVRNTAVVESRQHGRVTVRDVLVMLNRLPAGGDTALSRDQIEGILRAAAADEEAQLRAVITAAEAISGLEGLLSEKGVSSEASDLRQLNDLVRVVTPLCTAVLTPPETAAEGGEAAEGAAGGGAAQGVPGAIRTREDAVRTLENVCRFIEQAEPSNPAPLLIRRAQRLMSRSFVEIIQELAPESLDQIKGLAGIREE